MNTKRLELQKANEKFVYSTNEMIEKTKSGSVFPMEYEKKEHHIEKVMVTGGNGWLGRHIVDELAKECEVIVPIRARNKKEAQKRVAEFNWPESVSILPIDNLSDLEIIPVDSVIHLAADMSLALTLDKAWESNVELVKQMYEWAKKSNARSFHFVSSLSSMISSDRNAGIISESDKLNEQSKMYGGYGASKWCAEYWLMGQKENEDGIDIAIHRPGLLSWSEKYGWNENDGIYHWIKAVRQWGWPHWLDVDRVMGDRAKVDWTETSDASKGMARSVLDSHFGVFHWANNKSITFNMLRDIIENKITYDGEWPMDNLDAKKAKRALARFENKEKWQKHWWHDLFQSSHHFYDASNASRIQRQQNLDMRLLLGAVKEMDNKVLNNIGRKNQPR